MQKYLACWLGFFFLQGIASGQIFDERFDDWPIDLKINGTIAIADADESFLKFLERSGSGGAPNTLCLVTDHVDSDTLAEHVKAKFDSVTVRSIMDEMPAVDTFDAMLWHDTRLPSDIPAEELASLKSALQKTLESGKAVFAIGPQCKALSKYILASPAAPLPGIIEGMNLLPDCVVLTEFEPLSSQRQLLSVLAWHPRCVGIGLEHGSMLVLSGRKVQVFGPGRATFLLMANDRTPIRIESISEMQSRFRPEEWLVDLTEWRRDAIDRTLEPFPPAEVELPQVEHGSLVIVGGGGVPEGLMEKFVELAGGIDHAHLVYVPCSEEGDVSSDRSLLQTWEKMGVKQMAMIHTKDRRQANDDENFFRPLRDATGIWFGGGRQWNLADSYYGTTTHRLMKEVLHRGGVIGGSSAGASIQARYLARATPIENFKIMAPGYERGGLGFISGVAIDQHFSQRGRHKDMTQLVTRYPQLLGIGIDETTAIVVQRSIAEVYGRGKVHFYDRNQPVYPDRPDYIALEAGSSYDLVKRQAVESPKQSE